MRYERDKGKYGEMIIKIIPANATERWCYERCSFLGHLARAYSPPVL